MRTLFLHGITDEALMRAAAATGRSHRLMKLISARIAYQEGTRAEIEVRYEGMLTAKKADAVKYATGSEQQSIVLDPTNNIFFVPTNLTVPVPTITHLWVTSRGRPNILASGTAEMPPGITAAETTALARYYDDITPESFTLKQEWTLQRRELRSPADIPKSDVWEVTDTYEFVRHRVATSFS